MKVIQPMLQFQTEMRMFHWNTSSFSEHKAFGAVYDALDDQIDDFVETYTGIFGRVENEPFTLEIPAYSDLAKVRECITEFEDYLEAMTKEIPKETDLLNMRDGILGEVSHLRYLLTLK